jgi:hypothetical protein
VAIAHEKLTDLHNEVLKHLSYTLDLSFSDKYPEKHLKGRKSSTEEATLAVDGWFAAQLKEFLLDG